MSKCTVATKQLACAALVDQAIAEQWSARKLAIEAGVSQATAGKYLINAVEQIQRKVSNKIMRVSTGYRHTLESAAARSREFLDSIEAIELRDLDDRQLKLRKDAISSLSSISTLLKFSEPAPADAPPRLGNL